jgi:single-stranded-DNA-specific exonuclease
MDFKCTCKPVDAEEVAKLSAELGLNAIVTTVLAARGYNSVPKAKKFLNPSEDLLHSPYLLSDIRIALKRIEKAQKDGETVLVHGDYDVDGITSTALLISSLKRLRINAVPFIPNRLEDDFGFNVEGLDEARRAGASLVITCDCGTTSVATVQEANKLGIDVIITDHHQQSTELPEAVAIINPSHPNSKYPFKGLSGVGVVGKLVVAMSDHFNLNASLENLMRIVSIGTIADIMPLVDENRYIVKSGLETLHATNNIGIKELLRQAGLQGKDKLSASDIGYRVAPRINAAGRLGKQNLALELLLTGDSNKAFGLAKQLSDLNEDRQKLLEKTFELAREELAQRSNDVNAIVVGGKGWHAGIIGLVAANLTKEHYKPAFVYTIEDGRIIGSARTVGEIHLLPLLKECEDCFVRYGGHAQAAGFELHPNMISQFRRKMEQVAKQNISPSDLKRNYQIDSVLKLNDINLNLVDQLSLAEPYGNGNPTPRFLITNLVMSKEPFTLKNKHLKLFLNDSDGNRQEILFWDGLKYLSSIKDYGTIDIVVTLSSSVWKGEKKPQVTLQDFRKSKIHEMNS